MEAGIAVAAVQLVAVLAAVWLSGRRRLISGGLPYLVSAAVGVLLATALLHILPEAVESLGNRQLLWLTFTATICVLVCIERLFVAAVSHGPVPTDGGLPDHGHKGHGARPLGLVFGGMLHSLVDGVSVAAAFSVNRRVGWLTAIAIMLHEVPHRMGDFALLIHLHVSRRRALQLIVLVGIAAVAGVVLVQLAGKAFAGSAWLLPVSAASFVYIALVNLMPEITGEQKLSGAAVQMLLMLASAVIVSLILRLPAM